MDFYHHGIKGQKWGVRRSPEELGYRKRLSRKKIRSMSDTELQNRINRLNKEKQYKDLTRSNAEKMAMKIVSGIIVAAALEVSKNYVASHMKKGIPVVEKYVSNGIKNIMKSDINLSDASRLIKG